jgi:hypothetical protein
MKIDVSLRDAITSIDLSSSDTRYGAVALVVVLLENIWREEAKVPGKLEEYYNRIQFDYISLDNDLRDISYAISALYRTYGLCNFNRVGIRNYLKKINAF